MVDKFMQLPSAILGIAVFLTRKPSDLEQILAFLGQVIEREGWKGVAIIATAALGFIVFAVVMLLFAYYAMRLMLKLLPIAAGQAKTVADASLVSALAAHNAWRERRITAEVPLGINGATAGPGTSDRLHIKLEPVTSAFNLAQDAMVPHYEVRVTQIIAELRRLRPSARSFHGRIIWTCLSTVVIAYWLLSVSTPSGGRANPMVSPYAALGLGLAATVILQGLWLRVRAGRVKSALRANRAAFVLYLRSFTDDQLLSVNPTAGLERLTPLALLGDNVIGLGSPHEKIPSVTGAHIVLEENATWHDTVTVAVRNADQIVVLCGTSDWVRWEIALIASMGRLADTVFLFPKGEKLERWANFVRGMAETTAATRLQSIDPGTVDALYVDDQGTVVTVEACEPARIRNALAVAVFGIGLRRRGHAPETGLAGQVVSGSA